MGRLEQPSANEPDKGLKVDIVRHGPSTYRQPEWRDVNTADDLNALGRYKDGTRSEEDIAAGKEKAIEAVRASAEKIAADIGPDEEVIIWSSPTGRTLETARFISEVLQEKGVQLRRRGVSSEHGIKVFERIGEVKNFSWDLFEPLMNGGDVEFQGQKFVIEKSLSNPKGIGYPDYFTSDAIKNIPTEVKAQWPHKYVAEIERFESFADVTARMRDTLDKLKSLKDKKYRIIMVTHDALTGDLVKNFTSDQMSGVSPGQFLSLERKGGELVVTRAGDFTKMGDENAASLEN